MPRDSAGVYTLPPGNPVVTGTVIASPWANSTMSDIAAQLNNVLTRDGLLGPVQPFLITDGTVAAPGLGFASEPGLGWYREGTSRIALAGGNAKQVGIDLSVPTAPALAVWPRAAGSSAFSLFSDPAGTVNLDYFSINKQAAGVELGSYAAGTGTRKPMTYRASRHIFDGELPILGAVNNGRLVFTSGTQLTYRPENGNQVAINGVVYTIPAAGVTLSNAGLITGNQYYVYLLQTAGVLSLEAVATGHSRDATFGQEIKTGDPTRTLVGWVVMTAGNAFIDDLTRRQVASWANRKRVRCAVSLGGNVSTGSTVPLEIEVTYRLNFLQWAGEMCTALHSGMMNISTIGTGGINLNLLAAGNLDACTQGTSATGGYWLNAGCSGNFSIAGDNFHTLRVMASTNGGQIVLQGSATVGSRCALYADTNI